MKHNSLIAYAITKSLYEKDCFFDVFATFVIQAFEEGKGANYELIQSSVKNKFGLEIPTTTIDVLLKYLKRKGKVVYQRKGGPFFLTRKGTAVVKAYPGQEQQASERIQRLITSIKSFIKTEFSEEQSESDIYVALQTIINQNFEITVNFFEPDIALDALKNAKINTKLSQYIIRYFIHIQSSKSEEYEILREILYGSILLSAIHSPDISKVNKAFSNTQIYLDSNLLFSILDYDQYEFSKPAQELFALLKEYKFDIRIFHFTIEEIVSVFRNYKYEHHKYLGNVKVNTIYQRLKAKGVTVQGARELVYSIEKIITDQGISIDYKHSEDLRRHDFNMKALQKIGVYKNLAGSMSKRHDLLAIEKIRSIRRGQSKRIEDVNALFLSADLLLYKYNLFENGHASKATITEVVNDKVFTNILWLKHPKWNSELPLFNLISLHSSGLIVNRALWDSFYDEIRRLSDEKKISSEDISVLIAANEFEKSIQQLSANNKKAVSEAFILKEIKRAKEKIKRDKKKVVIVKDKEMDFLRQGLTEQQRALAERHAEDLEGVKVAFLRVARKKAEGKVKIYLGLPVLVISILLLGLVIWIMARWETCQNYAWGVPIIILTVLNTYLFVAGKPWGLIPFKILFDYRDRQVDKWLNEEYQRLIEANNLQNVLSGKI